MRHVDTRRSCRLVTPSAAERVARPLHVLAALAYREAHKSARLVVGKRRRVEDGHGRADDALLLGERLAPLDVAASVRLRDEKVAAMRLADGALPCVDVLMSCKCALQAIEQA